MICYISGKISKLSEDDYHSNFGMSGDELYGLYPQAKIVSPLGIRPLFGIKKWFFFMWNDIMELRKCTHIAMQHNWETSLGACIEHIIARFFFKLEVIKLKHECYETNETENV